MDIDDIVNGTEAQQILWDDLGATRQDLEKDYGNQYLRRQLVRGFCSYVEAHVFYLKATTLVVKKVVFDVLVSNRESVKARMEEFFFTKFDSAEMQLLKDSSPDIDESGNVKTTVRYVDVVRSIRFSNTSYLRAVKTGVVVDYQAHGWSALRDVIKLRNRLTHPKKAADLNVSDEDLKKLVLASDWYRDTSFRVNFAGSEKLKEFSDLLSAHNQAQ